MFRLFCFLCLLSISSLQTIKASPTYNAKQDTALISGIIAVLKNEINELKVYCEEEEQYKKANQEKQKELRIAKFQAMRIATIKKW